MDALFNGDRSLAFGQLRLPAIFDQPRIERAPSSEMASLRRKGLAASSLGGASAVQDQEASVEKMRNVVAVYNDQSRTIYLSDRWAGRTPAELSVLAHEMVHHLQNEAGITYECPAEREKLAYEAQDKWLGLFGSSLESEFQINGLALLISTSCAMAAGVPP